MPKSMPKKVGRQRVTLFDLDHTLLPLDSDYAWGVYTTQLGWNDAQAFDHRNNFFYEQYQQGTLDIHEYVRFATQSIRMQGAENSRQAMKSFMKEVIEPALRPEALELVRDHQRQSKNVIIITATNEFVTRPIADAFGVPDLIAVELQRAIDPSGKPGWITGEIQGMPSFREGKVVRFKQWLANHQLVLNDVEVSVFSDSMNDLPLLEIADHPIATNPDPKLRDLAVQRGWRILDLF